MILPIAQLGQPVLRRMASEVTPAEIASPEFQRLIDDMLETVTAAKGAGLAGPQVFQSKRLFVAGVLPAPEGRPQPLTVFINPRIVQHAEQRLFAWEGCLSFVELLVLVPRWASVRIEFLDRQGQPRTLDLEGWPARVVQHEYDHLDGVLTLDRTPSTRYIVKASEIKAANEELTRATERETT